MAQCRVPLNGVAGCGAAPSFEAFEAAFNAALLREQYRSLARLGPYVHGVVILAAGVRLTSACGFALFPSSTAEPGELVRLADAALYRAKAIGPGGAAVFDARAERTAACGAVFEGGFRRAVAESDGAIPFPPIVDFATGTAPLNRLRA